MTADAITAPEDLRALDKLPPQLAALLARALAARDEERRKIELAAARERREAWQALLAQARVDLVRDLAALLPPTASEPPEGWQGDGWLEFPLPGLAPICVQYDHDDDTGGWVRRTGFGVRPRRGYRLEFYGSLEEALVAAWDSRQTWDAPAAAGDDEVPF